MDVAACVTSSPGAWPRQRSCGLLVGAIFRSDSEERGPAAYTGHGGREDHLIEQRGPSSCLGSTQIGEWEFGKFPN